MTAEEFKKKVSENDPIQDRLFNLKNALYQAILVIDTIQEDLNLPDERTPQTTPEIVEENG